MAIPPLDFLEYPPAKPAKAAKEGPNFSRISSFSRGVGPEFTFFTATRSPDPRRHRRMAVDPPRARTPRPGGAAVVSRYARCEDWARAEAEARAAWCEPGRDDDRPAAEPPVQPGELPQELRQWPAAERYAVAELERGGMARDDAARHVREHGIPPELRGRVGATKSSGEGEGG